ncbi:hypothetical protein AMTRI_Chr13g121190 [Amborella trichopoda]
MNPNNDGRNYNWTSPQDDKLLDVIARCAKDNLMTNGVFRREGWAKITREMYDEYGTGFDRRRINNILRTFKTNYTNIKKLLGESGFGWIENSMCPYVHFAMLFYRITTVGHQNTRARASHMWLTWQLCLRKGQLKEIEALLS